MSWIVSLQLMFGLLFARRTLSHLVREQLIEIFFARKLLAAIGIVFFLITCLLQSRPSFQFLAFGAVFTALLSFRKFFERRLRSRIQSEFPGFINQIILSMQTGLSFRSAIERFFRDADELWQRWLKAMIDSRVLLRPQQVPTSLLGEHWCQNYLAELIQIDQNPHSSLTRLRSWRKKLKVISEFRRKSGQALLQARIQLAVMAVLYIALLLLTMTVRRISENLPIILLSVALFIAGQLLYWRISRPRHWKT